ncbi:kinase-like protein [Xylaria arbuscula]|nr:kinase-like protein [Xylaria arbuscula]
MDQSAEPDETLCIGYGLEWVENVKDYRPGGLHPVDMFDMLDGRFEVIHKLGNGGMSTVWLCYQKEIKSWRAVKINKASQSHDDSPEIRIMEILKKDGSVLRSDSHVVMPLEIFWIDGPNGRHLCTVLPLLGPTLTAWRENYLGTDATRINNACYQLTKGLAFLHSRGICHGDLRPGNALMRLKGNGLDEFEPEDLFQMLTYPNRREVYTIEGERSAHSPKFVIEPLCWPELTKYISDDVAIVDFGEAFEKSSPPSSLGIPRMYAAPEILYGGFSPGIGSDIWSLAFSILVIRTCATLGSTFCAPLCAMERFAGPIPPPFRQTAAEELYKENMRYGKRTGEIEKPMHPEESDQITGEALVGLTTNTTDNSGVHELELELSQELYGEVSAPGDDGKVHFDWIRYRLPETEVKILADLLSQLLRYQPDQRMRTSEILKHAWFKGIPEVDTASSQQA